MTISHTAKPHRKSPFLYEKGGWNLSVPYSGGTNTFSSVAIHSLTFLKLYQSAPQGKPHMRVERLTPAP